MTRILLDKRQFDRKETKVVEYGSLWASVFTFESGVSAMRLSNDRGSLVLLPYQGQQVWSAFFDGMELKMKSTYTEPFPTEEYLATYGGFLLHCGMTAMGVPTSAEDTHPLHGELPNAPYQKAYLVTGEDEKGKYIALSGEYEYKIAFNVYYIACPLLKLYEGKTVFEVSMEVENKKNVPMDYMYLCHINFHPVDGSTLCYSAKRDSGHVKVHINIPKHLASASGTGDLEKYMRALAETPSLHDAIAPERQVYDPEIVFTVLYEADEEGSAYTMQLLPSGKAFYVRHNTAELPVGVRWIARTKDEDALGMVLPATAEHIGRTVARRDGRIRQIPANGSIRIALSAGLLSADEATAVQGKIETILQ